MSPGSIAFIPLELMGQHGHLRVSCSDDFSQSQFRSARPHCIPALTLLLLSLTNSSNSIVHPEAQITQRLVRTLWRPPVSFSAQGDKERHPVYHVGP